MPGTAATKSQRHMAKTGGSLLPAGSLSCFLIAAVMHTACSFRDAAVEACASCVTHASAWQLAKAMLLGAVLSWLGCIWRAVRIAECAISALGQRSVYCLQGTCLPMLQ